MDASKNANYLRGVADAVAGFREAFENYLTLHVLNEHLARGVAPAVWPRDDADPVKINAAQRAVSEAAGLALHAPTLTHMMISVQGVGEIDPIAAWVTVGQPKPLLEPSNILDACGQMLGRLEALARKAEAEAPPTTGVEAMHPTIWGAARPLWVDGHFRAAVAAAAERLAATLKGLTGRLDVSETSLWQQTFSEKEPEPGKPRLRWPGDPTHQTVKSMNEGLRLLAPGVQMTIRNPATHGGELTAQEGLERLASLSLLAHWISTCELVHTHQPRIEGQGGS